MTLLELLIATSIMAIMAGVLGALAHSVQMQSQHSASHGEAVQHARVVLDRMQRVMNEAIANEQFPGIFVIPTTVGADMYPDMVAVWRPTGTPVDGNGLPRWNELVLYCPSTQNPAILLELTCPSDSRTVPSTSNLSSWRAELTSQLQSNASVKTELTSLLRTAKPGTANALRGVVRFDLFKRPSDSEWADYKANRLNWADLSWVQGIYGTRTGLRQVRCAIELQLRPGLDSDDPTGQQTLTFFGSAAVYHELRK